jgi:hypothetical protein
MLLSRCVMLKLTNGKSSNLKIGLLSTSFTWTVSLRAGRFLFMFANYLEEKALCLINILKVQLFKVI